MDAGPDRNTSFLPLSEAAERLGLSRLKLREAIAKGVLPARRDNQGDWRVDLTGINDLVHSVKGIQVDPDVLMGLLFDEIEALSTDLDSALTERDQFAQLTDRAMIAAEHAQAQTSALRQTTDRAFELLDRTTSALETARADITAKDHEIAGQTGQMDRLFSLSEQAVAKATMARRPGWIARVLGISGPAKG